MGAQAAHALVTVSICALHVAVVLWCLQRLPKREAPSWARALACVAYGVSCYAFGFAYHAAFFIDATLANIACCVAFVMAVCRCSGRSALFMGTAITICYESSRALVLYLALAWLDVPIGVFDADQALRVATEALGTGLAASSLWVLRSRADDLTQGPVRPVYLVALLQPLFVMTVLNIWQLPMVDAQSPRLWFAPHLLLVVVEVSVITSTMLVVFAISAERRHAEAERLESLIQSQHDALMMRNDADEAVERIAHDIKNHLTCIAQMRTGKEVEDHLKGIDDQLYALRRYPYTGDATLDIVLNEKAAVAREHDVDFVVLVDFSRGGFMRSVDVCAVFGNALDNALRAAQEVSDPAKRVVTVKCTAVAGFLSIKVTNYFAGEVRWEGGRPLSKKRQWRAHGLGLRSIEHSAGVYGGTVRVSAEGNEFTLSVTIPIPSE